MKKNALTTGIIAVLLASSSAYYLIEQNTGPIEKESTTYSAPAPSTPKETKGNIESVTMSGEMTTHYETVQDLATKADIIIEGRVIESSYFDFNTNTFTKSKIKISKSFKGDVQPGDEITIVEIGGITTKGNLQSYDPMKIKIPDNELNDPVEISFEGSKTAKKNEHVLFFAAERKDDFYQLGGTYYSTIGAYQSKFVIDNSQNVQRHSTVKNNPELKKKDSLFMTLPEIEKQIRESVSQ